MNLVKIDCLILLTLQKLCLVIQTVYIVLERDSVRRYNYGCLNALAYTLLTAATCIRLVMLLSRLSSFWFHDAFVILDMLQVCAAILCCLACLSLPRRPTVEDGGTPVDGQFTVTALGRYTFAWAGVTLVLARKNKTLGLEDLPKLHVEGRSAYRQRYLSTLKTRDQLWKTLMSAHILELVFQNIFTALQAAAQFIPEFIMYQLLKRLELRAKGASADRAIWGLVIALGLGIILAAWTNTWLHWIVWARLGQPIRTELSAMIFGKTTRRKDVKGMQKSRQVTGLDTANGASISTAFPGINDQETAQTHPMSGLAPDQTETMTAEDASEEDTQKSRQSTINLVVRLIPLLTNVQVGSMLAIGRGRKACLGLCCFLLSLPPNNFQIDSQHSVPDQADRLEKLVCGAVSVCNRSSSQHLHLKALDRCSGGPHEGPR